MDEHRFSLERLILRRFLLSGVWLVRVAVLAGILSYVITMQWRPEAGAGAKDTPLEQLAREDLHSPVWSLAFSSDGSYLAAATVAGDVWLEDLATRRVRRFLQGLGRTAPFLVFVPGEHVLAVAGEQPTVEFWDVDTGSERAAPVSARMIGSPLVFSPVGTLLAVRGRDGNGEPVVITLWDWPGRRRLATLEGHRGVINCLAFSPDGSRLASGDSQGLVKIWDLASRREQASFRAHELGIIKAVVFSPDGTLLATASHLDRQVRLWDAATGAPRGTLPTALTDVNALAFSSRRSTLAMASGGGVVSFWDVVRRQELGTLRIQGVRLQSLAFSPDSRRFATGGSDGAVPPLGPDPGTPQRCVPWPVRCRAFTPQRRAAAMSTSRQDRLAILRPCGVQGHLDIDLRPRLRWISGARSSSARFDSDILAS